MAKNQVVVYHKKSVPGHGMTRIFTDGNEPVTGHGKDYKKVAAEYATTHAGNVTKVVGLDGSAAKAVGAAKTKAEKASAGKPASTEVGPAKLKDGAKE